MTILVVVVFVVAFVVGYWWVRRPPRGGDHVSAEWRDEHLRERRD
jgi:hypothetical protein